MMSIKTCDVDDGRQDGDEECVINGEQEEEDEEDEEKDEEGKDRTRRNMKPFFKVIRRH
jgi:hypothetical protein